MPPSPLLPPELELPISPDLQLSSTPFNSTKILRATVPSADLLPHCISEFSTYTNFDMPDAVLIRIRTENQIFEGLVLGLDQWKEFSRIVETGFEKAKAQFESRNEKPVSTTKDNTMIDSTTPADPIPTSTEIAYAKIAYDAYCKRAGGVSLISGEKLPEFQVLKYEIKCAWVAAAMAVWQSRKNLKLLA